MLDSLSEFLAPPRCRDVLALLRGAFCLACVALVLRACFHFAPYRVGHRVRLMLFPALFCIGALAIFVYQASWQLAGHTRKSFVSYMERHNSRPDNAAHHLIRGEILDRGGERLAYTEADGSGRRVYEYADACAHVVGFRHPSEGLTGVERAADDALSGWKELRTMEDVKEAGLAELEDVKEAGLAAMRPDRRIGTNVVLTIDVGLQLRACSEFDRLKRRGAAVAIDPRTGEILLLFSSPSFDPNRFDRSLNVDPEGRLLNRALRGRYPSGSTFKTAIAALMVECGVPQELDCPADGFRLRSWRRPIRDHEYYAYERKGLRWPGFGRIGLDTALAKSSNAYFAQGGVLCKPAPFNAMVARLHLNESVTVYSNGVRSIDSIAGNCPPLKRAELQELAQRSIGQGTLLVTPLHMAMLTAAIANHGVLVPPRLARDEPPREPEREDHAWFVCFASRPGEEPSIAVAVVVENAGFGSAAALPVARGILKRFFQ